MKIKEISVECKLSKKYNTFTVSQTVEIEEGDDVEFIIKERQAYCRKYCQEQINIQSGK